MVTRKYQVAWGVDGIGQPADAGLVRSHKLAAHGAGNDGYRCTRGWAAAAIGDDRHNDNWAVPAHSTRRT